MTTTVLLDTLRSIETNGLQRLKEPVYRERVKAISNKNFTVETQKLQSRLSKPGPKQRLSFSQASLIGTNSYAPFVFDLIGSNIQTHTLCGYVYTAIETAVDYVEENSTRVHEEVFEQALTLVDNCSKAIGCVIAQSRDAVYTEQMNSTAVQNYERLINFLVELILCMSNVALDNVNNPRWKKVQNNHQQFLDSIAQACTEITKQTAFVHATPPSIQLAELSLDETATANKRIVKLPPKNPRFCGREIVLADMRSNLGADDGSLKGSVTLQGLGGIGKTSIALHYAYTEAPRYDVVLWMYSQTSIALAQSFTEAALKLELVGASGNQHLQNRELMKDWFSNTKAKWLVIFDNAEDDKLLGAYYPNDEDGSIIVTTRKPNFGYDLTAMEVQVTPFKEDEGTEALLKMATWNRSVPTDVEAAALMNKMLGGLPLGISQIAAIMRNKKIPIKRFLAIYEEDKARWHSENPRGGHHADYDQNISSVWNVSFKFLAEHLDAKIALGILCFLSPDSIPQSLFNQWETEDTRPRTLVLPFCKKFADFSQVQEDLLNDGLVDVDGETGAFSLHRLVQAQFEYYMDHGERQVAFENASKLLLDAWPRAYSGQRVSDQWPQCQMFIQHVLSLNEHYLKDAKKGERKYKGTVEFAELMSHVGWYLFEVSDFDHVNRVIAGGLKCCEELYDKPSENIIYAFLHHIAGTAEEGKGNFPASEKFLLIAEKSRRSRENAAFIIEDDLVATVNNLGLVYNSMNQFEKANHCFLECVELLKLRPQTPDRDMTIVMSDHNVARCTMQAGDLENARPLLEAQHAFYLKSTNWWMLCNSYFVMGNFHWTLGEPELAKAQYMEVRRLMIANNASKHPLAAASTYKLGYLKFHEAAQSPASVPTADLSNLLNQQSTCFNQKLLEEAISFLEESLSILALHPALLAESARVHYVLSQALLKRNSLDAPLDSKKHETKAVCLITNHCKNNRMEMPRNIGEKEYDNFVSIKTR